MGKWSLIRAGLRGIAAACAAVAPFFMSVPIATVSLVAIGAVCGAVTVDLPRDPWTDEQRQIKATK